MGLSLAQLRTELRDHLGVDTTELDDTAAELLLNRSWWKVADNYKFKQKEATASFNTVAGQEAYLIDTIDGSVGAESIQNLNIKDVNSLDYDPLTQGDETRFSAMRTLNTSVRGRPEHYIHRGTDILLYPIPDAVYSIKMNYLSVLNDLSTALTIPQAWHEAILYGAIWRGFAKFGDYNRSAMAKATQFELLNTQEPIAERELKADNQFASVQVLRRSYR